MEAQLKGAVLIALVVVPQWRCPILKPLSAKLPPKSETAPHSEWQNGKILGLGTQLHCGVTPGPAVCNLAAPAFWRKWRKTGRLLGCLSKIMTTIFSESWRRWSQVMTRWGGDVAWQRQILKCWRKLLSIWRLKIGRRGFLMTAWRQQFNTAWKLIVDQKLIINFLRARSGSTPVWTTP